MKIYLDTIGCRLNQAEIEQYARQFRAAGYTLVGEPEQADQAIINTCAVTTAAVSDSRQKVRQVARAGVEQIVLTGCWATLNPAEAAALPSVSQVVDNSGKDHLVHSLLHTPPESFDLEPVERTPLPGARLRTRAFIKVQDGCDNHCTFCVTTIARGESRSRSVTEVVNDIQAALAGGTQEIVLTGVHLGAWGKDFEKPQHLSHLIGKILANTDAARLRLSSLEPWDLDARFFDLWKDRRLCPHLHLPLQSGSAATLRRMARKTTPERFAELIQAARAAIPGVAITTDLIVGFPGETQFEFEESQAFVQTMRFSGGHIFSYSARPATAAARMPHQVAQALRKERSRLMHDLFEKSALEYQAGFVGQIMPVLWENARALGPDGWEMSGLTGNYLRVYATAAQQFWNQITPVKLTASAPGGLSGQISLSCC
jgi:threonylcarbamoyladenosine tRNA methylthiotransferase MtaB